MQAKSSPSQLSLKAVLRVFVDMSFLAAISLRFVFLCICILPKEYSENCTVLKPAIFALGESMCPCFGQGLLLFQFATLVEKLKHI